MQGTKARRARIGLFELDLGAGELRKDGRRVVLQEQPFQVLRMLVVRSGKLVMREEIRKELWPNDTVVGFDQGINTAIRKLREAFGDSAEKPKYIETVARRGYRLIVPVEWIESGPAPPVTPRASVPNLMGQKVSHYRVLEVLGGGGMGVVYKAEDLKLGRRVALKFLPEELASDPAALERFEREARAASALEHPNICPVYEFGEHEGQPFIAMQLLSGQTLRERIATEIQSRSGVVGPGLAPARPTQEPALIPQAREKGSALQVDELLILAIQIANGLEAAHSRGVIHRDIKPANIFITTRGEAKILDFGLAKLLDLTEEVPRTGPERDCRERGSQQDLPAAAFSSPHLTRTGTAVGTASYMSPEQIRCEKLDVRTDLFSFGTVLYQMATGCLAFEGATRAAIFSQILTQVPEPPLKLNPSLPPELQQIIHKALEKDREARYQSAAEMRFDLERIKTEIVSSGPVDTGSRQPASLPQRSWLAALVGAVIVAAVGVTIWLLAGRRSAQPAGPLRIEPFTGLSGLEDQPALSPDGKQLAYVWDDGSVRTLEQAAPHPPGHIYVKLIGAGAPLQLTHDARFDQSPAWSPDGRYIAFVRNSDPSDPSKSEVISVPALGGPERRLAQTFCSIQSVGRLLAWSPDGKSIAINSTDDSGLLLVSTENGEKRRLTSPPKGASDSDPAFSPDGRTLAFIRSTGAWRSEIYLQNVNSTEARRLTFDNTDIAGLAWTPNGRDIVFSSQRSGFTTLWKIPASGGEIEAMAGVGGNAFSPAVSARANLLAYVNQESHANIWGIRLTASGRAEGPPRKIISGTGVQVDGEISPDGKRIVFTSDRSGNMEIWVANIDGSNPLQLTSLHAPLTGSPRWSADGRWIAFDSELGENGGAFVVSAEGGAPRRLTPPGIWAMVPSWSRDGSSIYFSKNGGIWKMPVRGGEAVQVTKKGLETRESENGKWLYFSRPGDSTLFSALLSKTAILRMPVGGGPETLVFNGVTNRFWALAGQYLYFMHVDAKLHGTISRFNLATRQITRIADVEKDPYRIVGWTGFSVSSDGEQIIYPQLDEQISRIMLVENFRW